MTTFRDYLGETMKPNEQLKDLVGKAKSFMEVGNQLKMAKMKYDFSTSPMSIYMVYVGKDKYAIINKKYADKPDFVVGDIAVGKM